MRKVVSVTLALLCMGLLSPAQAHVQVYDKDPDERNDAEGFLYDVKRGVMWHSDGKFQFKVVMYDEWSNDEVAKGDFIELSIDSNDVSPFFEYEIEMKRVFRDEQDLTGRVTARLWRYESVSDPGPRRNFMGKVVMERPTSTAAIFRVRKDRVKPTNKVLRWRIETDQENPVICPTDIGCWDVAPDQGGRYHHKI